MNLKVGDKVRIKKDLKAGRHESNVMVQDFMLEYAGKVATIEKEICQGVFRIDLDSEMWTWYPFMFEEVIANKVPKLEAGMAVHCDTLDKSKIFLDECGRQGIKTMSGFPASSFTSLRTWNRLGESTCYSISKRNNRKSLVIMHANKSYYVGNPNYKLYEFDELFKENPVSEMTNSVETFMKAFKENIEQLSEGFSIDTRSIKPQGVLKPQEIVFTRGKSGNPLTLINKYKVLYEKQYYKGEKDVKKVIMNGKHIIVILENGAKGVAKCHPDDFFDKDIGFKVALKKARNYNDVGPAPF